jgi:endonuclease/exonuclease/phosphatase family metal-dependent hydrolase
MALRVATLNVWGTRGDWTARRAIMRQGFEELNADLITLQETIVIDGYDQARQFLDAGYHLAHQRNREADGQGVTTASRWPFGQVLEVDLQLSARTAGFAATCLITEVLAPEPWGRIWLANQLPDWRLDHEYERRIQTVAAARTLERLRAHRPGHVIVAGDLDADPEAGSVRFWTGRQDFDDFSVCYRDAWESARPGEPGPTFVPENPHAADWDWPFRRIDYILVRCGEHGGPTLPVTGCTRTFDQPATCVSDHYGVVADLTISPAGPQ